MLSYAALSIYLGFELAQRPTGLWPRPLVARVLTPCWEIEHWSPTWQAGGAYHCTNEEIQEAANHAIVIFIAITEGRMDELLVLGVSEPFVQHDRDFLCKWMYWICEMTLSIFYMSLMS